MIKIDYGYNISYLGPWSSFYLMKYPILPLDGNSRSKTTGVLGRGPYNVGRLTYSKYKYKPNIRTDNY